MTKTCFLNTNIGKKIIPRRDRPAKEEKPGFKDRHLEKNLDYRRGLIKTAARPARTK
jgi:hypothetical protein